MVQAKVSIQWKPVGFDYSSAEIETEDRRQIYVFCQAIHEAFTALVPERALEAMRTVDLGEPTVAGGDVPIVLGTQIDAALNGVITALDLTQSELDDVRGNIPETLQNLVLPEPGERGADEIAVEYGYETEPFGALKDRKYIFDPDTGETYCVEGRRLTINGDQPTFEMEGITGEATPYLEVRFLMDFQ